MIKVMKVRAISKKHPFFTSFVAFVLGALLVVGIQKVLADNTTIYACVNSTTGNVRIVSAGSSCIKSEYSLTWNQQGPQGPAGSNGDIFSLKPFLCSFCNLSAYANKFQGQDWSNSQIYNIIINNADIHSVNFSGSYITATFTNDNLTDANLSSLKDLYSNNIGMSFNNSNLTNANLSNNSFGHSDFMSANLDHTDFSNDNFDRGSFLGAKNMDTANLTNVTWSSNTQCPDGSFASAHQDSDGNPTCVGYLIPTPTP
jgi:hypothetical protein